MLVKYWILIIIQNYIYNIRRLNMKFIKVKGHLLDVLGEDARLTEEKIGISFVPQYQFLNKQIPISLGVITNEKLASKYYNYKNVSILDNISEANKIIDDEFISTYTIYNEGLMSANLNQKVANGTINLDEMQPGWTPQQEAEWLYKQGISGIRASQKPPCFKE